MSSFLNKLILFGMPIMNMANYPNKFHLIQFAKIKRVIQIHSEKNWDITPIRQYFKVYFFGKKMDKQ